MNPSSTAAAAVGATVGLVTVALLKKPLWAGLVLGVAGAIFTKAGIDKASQT